MMELSKRLSAVAAMAATGKVVADVGCDHGYIPIYLIEHGLTEKVIAMDVNRGPLKRAETHICERGLSAYIETRLSDGVNALAENEVDTVVIAGMGGMLTIHILENGKELLCSVRDLVLQPQSDLYAVRKYLQENYFKIIDENIVEEDGKYYPMMKVVHGAMHYDKDYEFRYGKISLQKKREVLEAYLRKKLVALSVIKTKMETENRDTIRIAKRLKEIAAEQDMLTKTLMLLGEEGGKG